MKKMMLAFAILATSFSAQAGFKTLTLEEVVATVLTSQELATEKQNNHITSTPLKSINVQAGDEATIVYLTYSSGGAPCGVKAEVKAVNTVPAGAAGVNMVAQIVSLRAACAMN